MTTQPERSRTARLLDAVTHNGPGYNTTPNTPSGSTEDRLRHLLDRARHGVILPAEGEQLAGLVGELERERDTLDAVCLSNKRAYVGAVQAVRTAEARIAELEAENATLRDALAHCPHKPRITELEAVIEQAELDAEQQDRHFRTICGERESYRQAWKDEQKQRATAEARVRELEASLGQVAGLVPGPTP